MPLIETLILSGTALTLGAYVLAAKIVKWDFETEAKFVPPPPPPPPTVPMTTELARAARVAVANKRAILQKDRDVWWATYEEYKMRAEQPDMAHGQHTQWIEHSNNCARNARDVDRRLLELADEEAKIPLYEEEKKT